MRYLSVCAGIEAASAAWHDLGWTPVAFSEIEPFPRAVLAQRFPSVPNWGDMTKFKEWPDADVDVLVGGTPCQSFSVAGLRKGLDDPRGSLMLTFLGIAARYRPRYVVWENVPGVLSSGGGRDFGSFLGALGELGYGWAYRVLDAQWFGVAQRRRRVFVVGCLGDQRRAAQVLFEREGVCRDPAPRREAREGSAAGTAARPRGGGGIGTDAELDGALIASTGPVSHCLNAGGMGRQDYETETLIAHSLRAEGFDASEDGTGRGTPLVPVAHTLQTQCGWATEDGTGRGAPLVPVHAFDARQSDVIQYGDRTGPIDTDGHSVAVAFSAKDHGADAGELAPTLRAMGHNASHANGGGQVAVAFAQNTRDEVRLQNGDGQIVGALAAEPGMKQTSYVAFAIQAGALRENPESGPDGAGVKSGLAYTLEARSEVQAVATTMQVRRLTPRECERLQGFPDDWTLISWRGRPADECPDGPRYKALGNSMAVPCMRWIGERIAAVESERQRDEAREALETKP